MEPSSRRTGTATVSSRRGVVSSAKSSSEKPRTFCISLSADSYLPFQATRYCLYEAKKFPNRSIAFARSFACGRVTTRK